MVVFSILDSLKEITQIPLVKALLTIALFFLLAHATLQLFKRYLKRLAERTEKHYDDILIRKIEIPFSAIVVFIGIRIALQILELSNFTKNLNETILLLLLTRILIVSVNILIDIWADKWKEKTKSEFEDEILPLIRSFVSAIIIIIILLFILRVWNVKIGPILTSLGIAGLAIGLALQNTLSNIFSGISLVMDKAFKSGDMIKLESGDVGRVKSIGVRSTQIVTLDNELMVIPNSKLANSHITNYAKPNNIVRIKIPVGVAYGSNIDKVEKVLLKSLNPFKDEMTKIPPEIRFKKMNDFSLDFELIFFITDYTRRLIIQSKITKEIYNNMNKAKIQIPFPTRTIYMKRK